tara:strand:+ start:5047 stop:5280 length:234 start_codon:yes stop_codon:yes gene_type:complete
MPWRNPWYKEEDPVDPKIALLENKGYTYDLEKDEWVRAWTTHNNTERVLEVYKKVDGEWQVSMLGDDGSLFFEEKAR